tara:strand:- start:6368 stop:6841 length:474 start_codon:yes stop_codon:yes gene_type:complete
MGKRGPKPAPKPLGAPVKLTPEVIRTLVNALQAGAYVETAVAHANISKTSYYEWIKKGGAERMRLEKGLKPRKTFGLFLDLLNAVEKAQADAELRDLAIISKASTEDWRASAWKLERRNPSKWGRQRIEAEVRGGLVVEGIEWFQQKIDAAQGFSDE